MNCLSTHIIKISMKNRVIVTTGGDMEQGDREEEKHLSVAFELS
jgi:hypothetical protein